MGPFPNQGDDNGPGRHAGSSKSPAGGRGRTRLDYMVTQADRAAEKRRAKLEDVQRQVDEGSLTIRKMTAEERKRFPPKPAASPPRKRRAG